MCLKTTISLNTMLTSSETTKVVTPILSNLEMIKVKFIVLRALRDPVAISHVFLNRNYNLRVQITELYAQTLKMIISLNAIILNIIIGVIKELLKA